jgi:hypothetical protein
MSSERLPILESAILCFKSAILLAVWSNGGLSACALECLIGKLCGCWDGSPPPSLYNLAVFHAGASISSTCGHSRVSSTPQSQRYPRLRTGIHWVNANTAVNPCYLPQRYVHSLRYGFSAKVIFRCGYHGFKQSAAVLCFPTISGPKSIRRDMLGYEILRK